MSALIPVEAHLASLVIEAANHLGLEVKIREISLTPVEGEFLSISTVRSETDQLVTYPLVSHSYHRERLISFPFQEGSEVAENSQRFVNEQIKRLGLYGPNTFIFKRSGELISIQEGVGEAALWSNLFSITSVFENALRSAYKLPLGVSELIQSNWIMARFDAPLNLEMQSPYLHLFAHEPRYRIRKLTSHSGYVALSNILNLKSEVIHAIDYLEGVINE